MGWLEKFIIESNHIEGIDRTPFNKEIEAHEKLLSLEILTVEDIEEFIKTIAPRHLIRDTYGRDVRVGDYYPPKGGPEIRAYLENILKDVNNSRLQGSPFRHHREYETLHPFTDGNGRSGRAIWLWGMQKTNQLSQAMSLGFLHNWYYQSLQG